MSRAIVEQVPQAVTDRAELPRRRSLVVLLSMLAGFALTVIWSASFVDDVIGDNVAGSVLGDDGLTHITGTLSGIVFAFVTGIAGSFTACNIGVLGAVGPLVGGTRGRPRPREVLRPVGFIALGILAVSATYGVIVALVGTRMPQFSTAKYSGISPRTLQSLIAFGAIGLIFVYLGLAALGLVPDVLARISLRFPNARNVVLGALIGGFLIGRPYPLFRTMFVHAANSHNVAYGATAFVLQSLGNIVVMTLLVLALVYLTGGRPQRWLAARPARIALVTAASLIVAGTFFLLYWDLRPLGRLGYIWYPTVSW